MPRFSSATNILSFLPRQVWRLPRSRHQSYLSNPSSSYRCVTESICRSRFPSPPSHGLNRFSARISLVRQHRHLFISKRLNAIHTPQQAASSETSLSGKLRKLSREYGWSALGIYLLLSALDFPFCFLAVRWLGTERIGRWEHAVIDFVKRAIPLQWPERWGGSSRLTKKRDGDEEKQDALMGYDHGVKEAQAKNDSEGATIWTQLALAYAIHKSFIFLRVPLTAAITPKAVKTLRGWGWNIGKRTPKSEKVVPNNTKNISKSN